MSRAWGRIVNEQTGDVIGGRITEDTFWVRVLDTDVWVADCCADDCWDYTGQPLGEFDNEAEAKACALAHRRWHKAQDAVEYGPSCPTCGTPARRRADVLARLAKAEREDGR